MAKILVFLLWMGFTFGLMTYMIFRKFKNTLHGKPDDRSDRLGDRLKYFMTNVVGQDKVLQDPISGLSHVMIMWGFVVLGFGAINLAVEGLFGVPVPFIGDNRLFITLKELFLLLVNDEIVLITSTSHPFAAKQVIDLREAAQETFIGFSKSSGLFVDTIEACGAAGFKPKFGYDTQYTDTCLGLVAEGLGIAMISSRTVMAAQRKNIAIVRFTPTARRTLSVVFPKKRKLSPVLSNFKNFFIHWLQEREYA